MTDGDAEHGDGGIDRRKFVAGLGVGLAGGMAGCSGSSSGQTESGGGGGTAATEAGTSDGSATESQEDVPQGGKPVLGMATAPNSLNVLSSSTAYTFTILDNIYTYGTYADPNTGKPIPGGFEDWTLKPENVDSSSPTIVAEMRDDLTWNDGKPVTAEDYKFTVEYVKEQQPAGSVSASQFSAVDHVDVDKPKGTTVNFYLKRKDRAWLTNVVGNVFLPKHVWKDVSNYKQYTPRKSEEGIVGSHAFELSDFNSQNWYELEPRSDEDVPWNQSFDFLRDDGPFIDALRFEIFGSETALTQAILKGNVDQTYEGVQVEKAASATDKENLRVLKSPDDGWGHISYNVRRVPLDDVAFRQLLNKLVDKRWMVEDLYKGIGVEKGTYATPKPFDNWRPEAPSDVDGKFEGIQVPNMAFPGSRGEFSIDQEGVDAARTFLMENGDASHEYSLGEAQSEKVEPIDGQEIYVDGEPIGQAHTDNAGDAGQGPLVVDKSPPSTSPKRTTLINNWVEVLRKVGIPVTKNVQSFNSMLPKVYANEDFDMFEMGWTGLSWMNDHYRQFFSSAGADLKNEVQAQKYNAMGYTGADDLIEKQATMMDPQERQPIVKEVLARLYHDAPTNILNHKRQLQPVTTGFDGRVKVVGGVTNPFTWLNIHQSSGSGSE